MKDLKELIASGLASALVISQPAVAQTRNYSESAKFVNQYVQTHGVNTSYEFHGKQVPAKRFDLKPGDSFLVFQFEGLSYLVVSIGRISPAANGGYFSVDYIDRSPRGNSVPDGTLDEVVRQEVDGKKVQIDLTEPTLKKGYPVVYESSISLAETMIRSYSVSNPGQTRLPKRK